MLATISRLRRRAVGMTPRTTRGRWLAEPREGLLRVRPEWLNATRINNRPCAALQAARIMQFSRSCAQQTVMRRDHALHGGDELHELRVRYRQR